MNDEILKKYIPEMGEIVNAVPGEPFTIECSEALLVIARRMERCGLKDELMVFCSIFSKEASSDDLSKAYVSYIKVKTFIEEGKEDVDPLLLRSILKELETARSKIKNIIHLSKLNMLTAEEGSKEAIKKTLDKYSFFLKAIEEELEKTKETIDSAPEEPEKEIKDEKREEPEEGPEEVPKEVPEEVPEPEEEIPEQSKEMEEVPDKKEDRPKAPRKLSLSDLAGNITGFLENKKRMKTFLKKEEAKSAASKCEEIPYYEKSLHFTESHICKDIPQFSVFKKKDSFFFGKTENASGGSYDNKDGSLLELLNGTDDFVQFLTEDLLTGDIQLKAFTDEEKKSMQLYFDFVCSCFEKHMGKELRVKQYLDFKDYYDKLVMQMMDLQKKDREKYYEALRTADDLLEIAESFGESIHSGKEEIIRKILSKDTEDLTKVLTIICESHVVNEDTKKWMDDLSERLKSVDSADKYVDRKEMADIQNIIVSFGGDEAVYSMENLGQAVEELLSRRASVKKIGFRYENKKFFVYELRDETDLVLIAQGFESSEDKEVFEEYKDMFFETIKAKGGEKIWK